ncbi:MAG: RidA family protein [Deltaproteobacteria bacterium]|nr:RidA family protein [Deltaproteobacteria bacterium]
MEMHFINPGELAKPVGYNHGVKVAGASTLLFLAGQVAWDGAGNLVGEGDFVVQFEKALENLLAVVRDAGGKPESVVKLNLYVTDKEKYVSSLKQVGQVYRKYMGKHFPAMTLVEVKSLYEPGTLLEIEGLAVL